MSYNELVKPTQVSWAPNGTTTFGYCGIDGVSGTPFGALASIQSSLETWQYGYDQVGNVTAIDNVGNASYDADNRLTGLPWSNESFVYDAIGNLDNIDGLGLGYSGSPVHAPRAVGATNFGYNAAGLLASDGTRTYQYDGENRLISVSQNGKPILNYSYDYDGKRLKRAHTAGTTVYIGERYEIDLASGETTSYYPWAGQPTPMRQSASLYLLHTDKLGSITNVSDASGASVGNRRYKAFGTVLSASGTFPTDRGFTGQIRDGSDPSTNWEFYFFRSRHYNAAIGKFAQPDTIVPNPKDPQALNRYAYALNNPLKLVDPSGHDPQGWNPNWIAAFRKNNGRAPTQQDWADYQFSLHHPGSGPDGTWTDQDWALYSQILAGGNIALRRQGVYLITDPPDVQKLVDGAPLWMQLLNFLPRLHSGALDVSVDVTRHGLSEHVRVDLSANPHERGVHFNPAFTLWIRLKSGQIVGIVDTRVAPYTGATIEPPGYRYAQFFSKEYSFDWGSLYGVSVSANPAMNGAILGTGEVDVGFGPP